MICLSCYAYHLCICTYLHKRQYSVLLLKKQIKKQTDKPYHCTKSHLKLFTLNKAAELI